MLSLNVFLFFLNLFLLSCNEIFQSMFSLLPTKNGMSKITVEWSATNLFIRSSPPPHKKTHLKKNLFNNLRIFTYLRHFKSSLMSQSFCVALNIKVEDFSKQIGNNLSSRVHGGGGNSQTFCPSWNLLTKIKSGVVGTIELFPI